MPPVPVPAPPPAAGPAASATAARIAFSLGWGMSVLYREGLPLQASATTPGARLPGLSRLSHQQRALLHLDQVDAGLKLLVEQTTGTGLKTPHTTKARYLTERPSANAASGQAAIYTLHLELLRFLTATDFRLGKTYGLGRALADSCSSADSIDELGKRFGRYRLEVLRTWLNDCASNLPPHSAKAVLIGLSRWQAWVANAQAAIEPDDWAEHAKPTTTTLHRQAEMWRSLLSGEKAGRDTLTVESYLKAATALRARLLTLIRPWLLRYGSLLILFIAVVCLAVAFLITNGTSQLVVGITGVAGALGISGKTLSTAVQKLGKTLEQPLWGAEIDEAVGEALTNLPPSPVDEPRADLLLETPVYLRAVNAAQPTTVEDLRKVAAARLSLRGDNLKFTERWSIRTQGAPWRGVSMQEISYWLNWAIAAGYVQPVAQTGEQPPAAIAPPGAQQPQPLAQADDTRRYELTADGLKLASIPRGEPSTVRAALTAAHQTTEVEPEHEDQGENVPHAPDAALAPEAVEHPA